MYNEYMGILVRQDEKRSQYQEKLAAELRERAARQAGGSEPLDQTKKSNYIKDTNQTSERAWLWAILATIVVVGFAVFIIVS